MVKDEYQGEKKDLFPKFVPWDIREVLVSLIVVISVIFSSKNFLLKNFSLENAYLIGDYILKILEIILPVSFVVLLHHAKLTTLGLTLGSNPKKLIFIGISAGVGFSFLNYLTIGYSLLPSIIKSHFTAKIIFLPILSIFTGKGFLALILGPLCEEVSQRGFIYPVLRKGCGVIWAILISATIFSLLHYDIDFLTFLSHFLKGVIFAYLYERCGTLLPSIAAHFTVNLINISIIYLLSFDKV